MGHPLIGAWVLAPVDAENAIVAKNLVLLVRVWATNGEAVTIAITALWDENDSLTIIGRLISIANVCESESLIIRHVVVAAGEESIITSSRQDKDTVGVRRNLYALGSNTCIDIDVSTWRGRNVGGRKAIGEDNRLGEWLEESANAHF